MSRRTFHEIQTMMMENFERLQQKCGRAFQTNVDKDRLWSIYLESFPSIRNPIFRTRREFDCSCCRHFVKSIGGIVLIDDELKRHTIWEFQTDDPDWQFVLDSMDKYVRHYCDITDVYYSSEAFVGTQHSIELSSDGVATRFEHFYIPMPSEYRVPTIALGTAQAHYRDTAHVFHRSLIEISMESVDTVLELIDSNSLYKGLEWKEALKKFRECKAVFDNLPITRKERYVWKYSGDIGDIVGRIRNHSIGALLTDISDGMDLNEAVARYEKIVAPANYKRPKAIYTAKMLEEARHTITKLGYLDSLYRRYAVLDDIAVNNVLFSNKDAAKRIGGNVFDSMMDDAMISAKKFDRVEEVPIEKFVTDILPSAKEVEAFVENRHAANMVSLIAPANKNAPTMFKWGNAFSWAYSGNLTDSDIRQNVKNAGGNVDGVLRFSIQWNDTVEFSANDLDAHCIEPYGGDHIFFGNKRSLRTHGCLDIDIQHPFRGKPAVENITWPSRKNMLPGNYKFYVRQYANRGGRDGFRAEIAFDGQTFQFDYPNALRQGESVRVATVYMDRDGTFTIQQQLPSVTASKDIWGIKTMQFTPVSVIMLSPNYWDEQHGIGNKHYMFMLKDCVNPEEPNGFYNEFLKQELMEHKRVLEALGSKMAVEFTDDQLSGLGFSSTIRNDLIVKVKGATERIMKIKF